MGLSLAIFVIAHQHVSPLSACFLEESASGRLDRDDGKPSFLVISSGSYVQSRALKNLRIPLRNYCVVGNLLFLPSATSADGIVNKQKRHCPIPHIKQLSMHGVLKLVVTWEIAEVFCYVIPTWLSSIDRQAQTRLHPPSKSTLSRLHPTSAYDNSIVDNLIKRGEAGNRHGECCYQL